MAELRHAPLSFGPAPSVARDEQFDERLFDRVAAQAEPLEDEAEGEEAPPSREGLPSSYRMRHDTHYVEQIASRSRPVIPAAVFADLTEHLGAIGACLHLFGSDRERPLRERVALGLLRAEVQRAAWLTQAIAVLGCDPPLAANAVDVGVVVERVLGGFAAERTLGGAEFDYEGGGPQVVRGDEQLLGVAFAGVVFAIHAIVERVPGATVRVQVAPAPPPGGASVTVSQDAVSLPPTWRSRFFEIGWTERPGGVGAGARLAAARRVAELHGGKLQLSVADYGCALTLTLPASRA